MNAIQLIPFLRAARIFDSWTDQALLNHLVWRAERGQLLVVEDTAGRPQAVVAWHRAATAEGLSAAYVKREEAGRFLYWDFIATAPGVTLAALWQRFTLRVAGWRGLTMLAHRKGQLEQWPAERFARLVTRTKGVKHG